MALVTKSALPTSLLPDDNFTPAVALGHPFPSIRQAIENLLKLTNGCAPYCNRILHSFLYSSPCKFEERLGPIPTRSRSVPSSTHPLSRRGTEPITKISSV